MISCKYHIPVPFPQLVFGDPEIITWMKRVEDIAAGRIVCGKMNVVYGCEAYLHHAEAPDRVSTHMPYNLIRTEFKCFVCGKKIVRDQYTKLHETKAAIMKDFHTNYNIQECARCHTLYQSDNENYYGILTPQTT